MGALERYKKIGITVLISGSAFIINYLISFFLAPVITSKVGTEAYGFVTLAKNMAVYATYLTIALNSYAARYISIEYYNHDMGKANIFFSSTFWGDVFLGSLLFSLACIGIVFLEKIFKIPVDIVGDIKLLFFFVFLKFLLVTIFSVYGTGAYISNKLYLTGIFKGLSYGIEAMILIVLFAFFKANVFYVGIGILAAAIVTVVSDVWICNRYTKELKVHRSDFRLEAVKALVANGVWSSVSSLGNLLNSGLDLTICNLMISPLAMGQLAITESVSVIFSSLYTMIADAFKPTFLKLYAEKNITKLVQEFKIATKITGLVANLCFAGFLSLGTVYYRLWIPNQDIDLIFRLTMVVLGSGMLVAIESPLFFIYTLTLSRRISCMFTLITGFLNVISMYVLIKYFHMGIFVVVGTTFVLQSLIHILPHPIYMAYVLKIPWYSFYPEILRNLLSCAVLCMTFLGFRFLYTPKSWMLLAVCILFYATIGSLLHLAIVFNKQEWNILFRHVKKKFA